MYIVVEYNDGKELFLDGDGQKQFMEELAEAEATGDEILVEKIFGVGSDYHGIAEEVVEAEEFEADEDDEAYIRYRYGEPLENMSISRKLDSVADSLKDLTSLDMLFTVINNLSTKQANQLINRLYAGIREGSIRTKPFRDNERFGAEEGAFYQLEVKYNMADGWEHYGDYDDKQDAINAYYDIYLEHPEVKLLEVDYEDGYVASEIYSQRNFDLGAKDFEATKRIDTYSQPFEELRIKPSKAKVGILLASIVASGVWFVNKMKRTNYAKRKRLC